MSPPEEEMISLVPTVEPTLGPTLAPTVAPTIGGLKLDEETMKWLSKAAFAIPRCLGTMTVVCSACMIWIAWDRREHIFHRLVLGMAINMLVLGVFLVYGTAAFPEDDEFFEDWGHGTTNTCTVQGFFIQFGFYSALFYYSFFSVYSYVGVLNNFQVSKFGWVEKYIHVSAHIFPIVFAFVELTSQTYNPAAVGICIFSTRSPVFCESETNSSLCERGHPETTHHWLIIIVGILMIAFATGVMVALYFKVKRNQSNVRILAKALAKQAVIYLFVLYWVAVPMVIALILNWLSEGIKLRKEIQMFTFLTFINIQFFGLFSLLVYRYFSVGTYHRHGSTRSLTDRKITMIGDGGSRIATKGAAQVVRESDSVNDGTTASTQQYSFNIFDGTNAGGAFADFIHGADSDDDSVDNRESVYWNGVQGLNSTRPKEEPSTPSSD